ncbi:porin [Maritimibacter sp. DP07]|uniref:Porin n=1 Tax=Maritimibacter harenae TaxID=2606218 RepID=A0A845MA39_9RHOB|nr:porin [Maritimibacter harenae]MZR15107.1 porin [Maritimibacter harenae]
MKKILLASTMLVGTTGFAAADVSLTGAAYVGGAYSWVTGGATTGPVIDFRTSFRAGMMTTTDGGLEVGAGMVVLGPFFNMEKDPDDVDFGTYTAFSGITLAASNVYMSGEWGKVNVAYNSNADGASSTPGDWELTTTYTNTWGAFGVEVYGVWENNAVATTNGDFGAKGTYSFGDYSVYVEYGYDANDGGAFSHNIGAGASLAMSGFSANADVDYDLTNNAWGWHVDVGYATGPYSVMAFLNDGLNYGVEGAYDLGGGVSIKAGYAGNQATTTNAVYAGVSMAF